MKYLLSIFVTIFLASPALAFTGFNPDYAYDFSDDRILMGISHYVFVGKVIEVVGKENISSFPAIQFSVQVILNIKGQLEGNVIVNQAGACTGGGCDGPLHAGYTYVFATRHTDSPWYTISVPPDRTLISRDTTLDNAQLLTLVRKDQRVLALERAYPNEILSPGDISRHTTFNSYQSLPLVKRGEFLISVVIPTIVVSLIIIVAIIFGIRRLRRSKIKRASVAV
jgi:hypothetical protein